MNPPISPTFEQTSSHVRKPALVVILLAILAIAVVLFPPFTFGPIVPDADPQPRSGHTINGAYLYQQQRSLSCEYASTAIAATIAGHTISEYDFDAVVPLHENPHVGYRGNIHGTWGNTTDYGVYNEPLHMALADFGISSSAFYAHGDALRLKEELAHDRPVVVWLAMWGDVNSFDAYTTDGARYQLTQGMHVMTAYGYDERGVYLTDPGTAVYQFYEWDEFMAMWNVMDGMALSVHR